LFTQLNQNAVYSFASPDRMGYVRSRDEVTGFEPHLLDAVDWPNSRISRNADWQITRLELVSLLRQPEPRVYVAANMPNMDQLTDVPTRALNTFEATALPQLTTQEDIVVKYQPGQIEMLGALRAGKTCLECHRGERGKLLGAFSYTLVAVPSSRD